MEKVCIPISGAAMGTALRSIRKAERIADLIELRVDTIRHPDLPRLLRGRKRPVIVTNRRKEEGGEFEGEESARTSLLQEAVRTGADYVDIEVRSERRSIESLIQKAWEKKSRVILSYHNMNETPAPKDLRKLCDKMIRTRADVIKIVTFARSWEDNLAVLALIPYARERKQMITAFSMGPLGTLSRVAAPLIGSVWTYACLDRRTASAPGQMTLREMKEIWERLA